MAWPVQDAKARFSELLETALSSGPQIVTKRGVEAAVLVSMEEWKRLKGEKKSLKELLLQPGPYFDFDIPSRRKKVYQRRPPIEF